MGNPGEIIRLISESFVRPHEEVEAAKHHYYLGPIDLSYLSINPIQKGLLFKLHHQTGPEISSLMESLSRSLSLALLHFYPLAGRLETIKYHDQHACFIYVDCIKGPGARLIHASVDLTVSDILYSLDVHPAVRSFFDLGEKIVSYDGHTKALLSVQVTELLDGVFIGFSLSHALLDGTSFIHFLSLLSEIFRLKGDQYPNRISQVPLYKMYAPDGYGPIFKLPYLEPEEFVTRFDPGLLRQRIFHFSPMSIARLKAKANEECGPTHVVSISSFMALSGLVWRSMTRAWNPPPHDNTCCCLALNARPRLDPPLSDHYFGNFLGLVRVVCNVGELLGQSLGWATTLLAQEVKSIDHEAINTYVKMFADRPIVRQPGSKQKKFYGAANNVVIGGSPRFDMYGPEFGLGRAMAVRMGDANRVNRKVNANPGWEGGGSVDLEICLKPEAMNSLELDKEFMSFVSTR